MIAALSIRAVGAVHAASTPPAVPDESEVNPGVWGFLITFLLAIAVIVIIFDMIRRVRRMNYRAQAQLELAAEAAEAAAATELPSESEQGGIDESQDPPKTTPPAP